MVGASIPPAPFRKLFQIHGSKFKLHPDCNLSQACVSGIAHSVLLLRIRKDTFYRFFSCLVHPLVDWRVPGIICQFLVILPDVPGDCFHTVLALCAKMSCRTVCTDLWITFILPVSIPVCSAVIQYLIFRTDDAVEVRIVHILPPFMPTLHGLRALVGCG